MRSIEPLIAMVTSAGLSRPIAPGHRVLSEGADFPGCGGLGGLRKARFIQLSIDMKRRPVNPADHGKPAVAQRRADRNRLEVDQMARRGVRSQPEFGPNRAKFDGRDQLIRQTRDGLRSQAHHTG